MPLKCPRRPLKITSPFLDQTQAKQIVREKASQQSQHGGHTEHFYNSKTQTCGAYSETSTSSFWRFTLRSKVWKTKNELARRIYQRCFALGRVVPIQATFLIEKRSNPSQKTVRKPVSQWTLPWNDYLLRLAAPLCWRQQKHIHTVGICRGMDYMHGIHRLRLSLLSEWQELGPKLTTNARFGFQLLLNYTGGALIFIRRECLCKKYHCSCFMQFLLRPVCSGLLAVG